MLKKLTILCAIIACLASAVCAESYKISLTAEEKAWLQQHPVISKGAMNNGPPLNFTDTGGKPQGIGLAYVEV